MKIRLMTTGCPKCQVLKQKLDEKHIPYETVTDVDEMIKLGIEDVPQLEVDGELLPFDVAIKFIKVVTE